MIPRARLHELARRRSQRAVYRAAMRQRRGEIEDVLDELGWPWDSGLSFLLDAAIAAGDC